MGIFKEELMELRELQSKQVRIYPDACDLGIWDTPNTRKQIQNLIHNLPSGTSKNIERNRKVIGRTFKTEIIWEMDGPYKNATQISINWYSKDSDPTHLKNSYFEIQIH